MGTPKSCELARAIRVASAERFAEDADGAGANAVQGEKFVLGDVCHGLEGPETGRVERPSRRRTDLRQFRHLSILGSMTSGCE